jgi:hypothetical protein
VAKQVAVQSNGAERLVGGVTGKGFMKGKSGNPGGQPKGLVDIKAAAQEHSADAIRRLADVMLGVETPPAAIVAAATALLDRGFGRPNQSMEIDMTVKNEIARRLEDARERVRKRSE